ncbi:hypothetical protein CEXT_433051 [Caerostris extrusa]|uniref:Uncharacterized protein n=1 Tax=Caerostris extrusa TaxID=172846 RepID=A0AAV4SFS5_CAEEX|nr:hypothetical protein CEXT_433051 [Caerostris extrusa]
METYSGMELFQYLLYQLSYFVFFTPTYQVYPRIPTKKQHAPYQQGKHTTSLMCTCASKFHSGLYIALFTKGGKNSQRLSIIHVTREVRYSQGFPRQLALDK